LNVTPGEPLVVYIGQGATGNSNNTPNCEAAYITRDSSLPINSSLVVALGGETASNNQTNEALGGALYNYTGVQATLNASRIEYVGGNGASRITSSGGTWWRWRFFCQLNFKWNRWLRSIRW
jgi:hypothetical protein